jgi:hypothetical protein
LPWHDHQIDLAGKICSSSGRRNGFFYEDYYLPMSKLRVPLADDHELFRAGLADILNAQPDFDVAGEASDGLQVAVKAV